MHHFSTRILSTLVLLAILVITNCDQKPVVNIEVGPMLGTFTSVDEMDIFFKVVGSGEDTLIVMHGGPGMDSEYMVDDFTDLANDYTLLFYDQRGGGQSSLPENPDLLHIDKHVADLEELRKQFGLSKMTLVAHSFGPMVAAQYAIAYPERVSKMVFLGPVPPMQGDFGDRYGTNLSSRLTEDEQREMRIHYASMMRSNDVKSACTEYWNIALKPRIAEGLDVSIVKGDPCAASHEAIRYGMQTTNAATFGSLGAWDLRPQVKDLSIPTLVLHGVQEAIPMDMVEEWATSMPNAQLIKVPEAGHFAYVERPDIVWPAIREFLQRD